jgi:putative nucleotidyltransferase with HDIG domain
MRLRAIHIYVLALGTVALSVLWLMDWHTVADLGSGHLRALLFLTLIGIVSEWLSVSVKVGRASGGSSITFLPLLACVLLFGPEATIFFWAITGLVAEFFLKKKEPLRAAFNAAQYIVSAALAGWVFEASGGIALVDLLGVDPQANWATQMPALVAFGVTFLAVNHAAVSLAIALSEGASFSGIWAILIGRSGTNIFYDLLLSPLGVALAALYLSIGVSGFLVILLPLIFIRHAYATNSRLQQANRDLLRVLIKAIETRDPYTSGHSLRVQALSSSVARALGITGRRLDWIETAALLHDIGKIDVIYADILKKDGSLSVQERAVIESHVLKGVELLTSLTSFNDEVIRAVKHHHEWHDGSGYPDGIAGAEIPLGAKIIMLSDSIDAMLSDRPYRNALTLEQVYEQLTIYSGRQFDPDIVRTVIQTGVLHGYVRPSPVSEMTQQAGMAEMGSGLRANSLRSVQSALNIRVPEPL